MRRWGLAGLGLGTAVGLGVLAWWSVGDDASIEAERREGRRLLSVVEGPTERPAAREGAPNVVLVIGCTFRKDQTSVYNPDLPQTTPFLASLAADGVVLDDLVNAAPWTKAASTAIVTGHHAVGIGMVEPRSTRNAKVLPDEVETVAEAFHAAGYRTYGLTTNPNVHSRMGFAQGFERYAEPAELWRENMAKAPGRAAVRQALDWVDDLDDGAPFYLQVLLVDAHAPFPRDTVEAEDGAPALVGHYRAGLQRLDAEIERLVDGLRAAGHGEDTYVVVVNDHGEGLEWPKHHGKGHGRYLAPSAVGGIGVFHGPGLPAGHRVEGLASQIDLAPTLLGLAGVEGWGGPGFDLAPVVRGRSESPRTEAFTDTWFRKSQRAARYTGGRMCQINLNKADVVDRHGHRYAEGCFDRVADPTFAAEALRDPEGEAAVLRWRVEQQAEARQRAAAVDLELDDDLSQQLEALGYTGGDEE